MRTPKNMIALELSYIEPARFSQVDVPSLSIDGLDIPSSEITNNDSLFVADAPSRTFQVRLSAKNRYGCRQQLILVAGCLGGGTIRAQVNERYFASGQLPTSSGKAIALVTVTPKGAPQAGAEPNEITTAVETDAVIDVVVTFEVNNVGDRVYLLVGKDSASHGARISTITDRNYTRTANLFCFAIWGLVIGGTVLWYCFHQSNSKVAGAVPFSAALLHYLVTTLVPRDSLKQWSLNELIRRLHANLRVEYRRMIAALTSLITLSVLTFMAVVLAALLTKLSYIALIESSLAPNEKDFSNIVAAFERIPWRRDSFLVYELRSRSLKASQTTQEQWRSLTKRFITDYRVERIIDPGKWDEITSRILRWVLLPSDEEGLVLQDPVIAVAHIMAEAEPRDQIEFEKRAVELLRKKRPDNSRATLLMLYLEYDLAAYRDSKGRSVWPRTPSEVIQSLNEAAARYLKEGNAPATQEYVQAIDLIGYFSLVSRAHACDEDTMRNVVSRFATVLQLRLKSETYQSRSTWRSPGKLRVYQLWSYFMAGGREQLDPIWGQYFEEYHRIYASCPRVKKDLNELFRNNDLSQASQSDRWMSGTAFDEKGYRQFVIDEMQRGWRL